VTAINEVKHEASSVLLHEVASTVNYRRFGENCRLRLQGLSSLRKVPCPYGKTQIRRTNCREISLLVCLLKFWMLCDFFIFDIFDIFVNWNWVATRWQWYSTHLHTNNT
jgi:hypothetical protein